MGSDNRLIVIIVAALVLLIAAPLVYLKIRDARRPVLETVRIVTASRLDPVFRTGARSVGPAEEVQVAAALELRYPGDQRRWLAPVSELEIDGRTVDHTESAEWPEKDRRVRVFWFTVESSNVGGLVSPDNAERRLRYRPFLAPEMGHGLLAQASPEVHHDDSLGPQPDSLPIAAGTQRLYVKVEVIDPENSEVRAVQTASTRGTEHILDDDFPAIRRSAEVPEGLHPAVGELFNLPGWETEPDSEEVKDRVAQAAFGTSFDELVERRLVTSSSSFAAVAVAGSPALPSGTLEQVEDLVIESGNAGRGGRPVRWGEVGPGDCLVRDGRYTVLMSDDGNGRLDAEDLVAYCWRRPPVLSRLGLVHPGDDVRLEVYRVVR